MLRSALVALTLLAAVVDSVARKAIGEKVLAGMAVIAVQGRDTLLARGYGRADLENDVRMTVGHVFQFASVTKQFTAAAVLALVQDRRVALDASITRYLPKAPVQGRTITVRQLLSHTSGIPDYAESPRIPALKRLDLPPDSLLALVATTPFYFEPGEQMRYSNTNFALLGRLIEQASGQPYATYVEQRVLRPAGATRAHFCDPQALVRHLARGYAATPDGLRPAAFISPHLPYAAGGFCGTAGDLTAWNAALHARRGGRVLAPTLYAEMVAPQSVAGGRRTRHGLGVALSDVAGRPAVHHGGDIDGFTTFTAYLPDGWCRWCAGSGCGEVRPNRSPSAGAADAHDRRVGCRPHYVPSRSHAALAGSSGPSRARTVERGAVPAPPAGCGFVSGLAERQECVIRRKGVP